MLQMEVTECGAIALGILFARYGLFLSLERLREECGVSRDGTNARRLIEVARKYGFEASGVKLELEELKNLPPPAILHWDFDHFVVFEGMGRKRAFINDPARGRKSIPLREMDRHFTGPALLIHPGPRFMPEGSPPRIGTALRRWLKGSSRELALLITLGLLLVGPGIAVPMLTASYVDHVLVREAMTRPTLLIAGLIAGLLTIACVQAGLLWLQRNALNQLSQRISRRLSSDYLKTALHLPFPFHLARHPYELASRVEIGDRLSWLLSGDLPSAFLSLLFSGFYALAMLLISAELSFAVFGFAALGIAVSRIGSFVREEQATQVASESARWLTLTAGGMEAIETIKANGSEGEFLRHWRNAQITCLNAQHKLWASSAVFGTGVSFLQGLAGVVILALGGLRVMHGTMSLGMLMAFQGLMIGFFAPIGELARFVGQLSEYQAQVSRFRDVLDYRAPEAKRARGTTLPSLHIKRLVFGYDPARRPIITNLSLAISPGQFVAIVGRTGSGKSTVGRLVSGLLAPWSGEIIAPKPECLGYVEQETRLFQGTLAENIALWNGGTDKASIARACEDAALSELIARLPSGLKTQVSEGGRNFSGGERQRLAIARALARNPSFLILDEATSALDPETEALIYRKIRNRGVSCLVIAHRMSAIAGSDRIFVLENGSVAEQGTHSELSRAEIYPRLLLAEG